MKNDKHPPEPGPEAFLVVRDFLADLAVQLAAIPDELIAGRFDASLHSPLVNWTVYCLMLVGEYCSAASDLAEKRHARVLTTLARTVYEFCIAQLYAERHPDIARDQFTTFYGRSLRRFVEMQPDNADARKELEQWETDAKRNKATYYSGNFNNKAAISEIDGEAAWGLFYGEMSTFAHPDAAGYSDVFRFDFKNDGLSVGFLEGTSYHAFDALCLVGKHAVRALRAGVDQLKLHGIDVGTFDRRLRHVITLHFFLDN